MLHFRGPCDRRARAERFISAILSAHRNRTGMKRSDGGTAEERPHVSFLQPLERRDNSSRRTVRGDREIKESVDASCTESLQVALGDVPGAWRAVAVEEKGSGLCLSEDRGGNWREKCRRSR